MQNNELMIVAEISANHCGSINNAFYLIDAAKYSGADAVKFQTYIPEEIAADVMIDSGPWAGRSYRDLYKQGATPWKWHEVLFSYAKGQGLIPFSSPFSEHAVELLKSIDCPIYKIASPEITHLALIEAAAKTKKPLLISTGMASLGEIYRANQVALCAGAESVTFLHCISAYPAPVESFNLINMRNMWDRGFKIGLSDHSMSLEVPVMAVALGARVIEAHLIIDRAHGGLDAPFSREPDEFATMVRMCRAAHSAMGTEPDYSCKPAESSSHQYRRSIWVVAPVKRGHLLNAGNLAILRPNYGLPPSSYQDVIGQVAKVDIPANTPLTWDLLK